MSNEQSKNSPAFQYYPADLLSDPEVMLWDMESVGCYWQMISYLWINGGKVEVNSDFFCKLFRVNRKKTAEKLWNKIKGKFVIDNGIAMHKRVLKEMQRQEESRLRRQEAGKKGAKSRWHSHENENGNAKVLPLAKNGYSSSTSTSLSNTIDNSINPSQNSKMAMPSLTTEQFEFSHNQDKYIQELIKTWNKASKKKVTESDIESLASEITRILNHLRFGEIIEAVKNYGDARKIKNTMAGDFKCATFLRDFLNPEKTGKYRSAYFDIDNYDPEKWKTNNLKPEKMTIEEKKKAMRI
jgi:uncharacterized protein YdaU (DUF1376 family)